MQPRIPRNWDKKKIGKIVLILVVLFLAIRTIQVAANRLGRSTAEQLGSTAPEAITVPVEREFTFIVYDKDKLLADPIRYAITSVQLTKQIIIKGQRANAVTGRNFLILNLKLINDFDKSLFLNTRNYIRVQPASTEDKLASEIHNDTVEVQPLSTKLTRLGLPVDEGVKEFILHVGELDGPKEQIDIKFPE